MESIAQQKRIRIDIDGRTAVVTGKDDLYQGDSYANEIVVEVLRGGVAADLTGYTASGEMQRSDEAKVPCEGSVAGNVITITLNPHCYKEAGGYMLSVKLSKSTEETTRTVLRIFGEVQRAASGPTVDISETLVDVDAVLELYEEMKNATREAEEAAENAKNLPTISTDGFWELWDAAVGAYVATLRRSMPAFTFQAMTGAPGTNVQLVQTGTAEEPVITLTIPRGETGAVEGIDYFAGSPSALGEASPGTANGVARGDHVHPLPGLNVLGAVSYNAQALTDEQKVQARENIGAGEPYSYTLPTATADELGGVKVGFGLDEQDDGTLSVAREKTLWSGTWESGSITVPDINKYTLFRISMEGQGTSVVATRTATHIRGIGGYSSATPSILTYHFAATVDNETLTLVACNNLKHIPSGGHEEAASLIVTSIIGLR